MNVITKTKIFECSGVYEANEMVKRLQSNGHRNIKLDVVNVGIVDAFDYLEEWTHHLN